MQPLFFEFEIQLIIFEPSSKEREEE